MFLLCTIFLNYSTNLFAQSRSLNESKKLLCSKRWIVVGEIEDGKKKASMIKGLVYVFKTDNTAHYFYPEDGEEDKAPVFNYELTLTKINLTHKEEKGSYTYSIKDDNGIKLFLIDDIQPNITIVFKQVEE